jgi:penicillin-binding protein 1A
MVLIITACIVAVTLTVYVMRFAEDEFDIDLKNVELTFSSFVYAYDEYGNAVEQKQLSTDENRVWVDINDMPDQLLEAVIAVEDQRFFEHDGVDWRRTISATVQALFTDGNGGGSTITQQLIRDVTKDNDVTVGRKLREIFRALSLEQKYTKMDILESYLNRISFGGTSYGVGSASRQYFDKETKDLTLAESAILASIIRSPSNYNPYANLERCKERQIYALRDCMYEQGRITTAQYEQAAEEKVRFRLPVKGDAFGYIDERYDEYAGVNAEIGTSVEELYYLNEDLDDLRDYVAYKWNGGYEVTQNWYMDACLNQVIKDMAALKGLTTAEAREMVYKGGMTIYSNEDLKMQKELDERMSDPLVALRFYDENAKREDLLQAAFVVMDYHGRVLAVSGGLGEKEGDNAYNRATMSLRSVGSTIKPISVYSTAVEANAVTYSTFMRDVSGEISVGGNANIRTRWPLNYEQTFPGTGDYYPVWFAVMRSMNTIAVRTLYTVGRPAAYAQLEDRLGVTSLDREHDMAYSPLALGALYNGMSLYELAAAYQIMGNGGVYYEPYFYSKVVDSNGTVILEQNPVGVQAISRDTSWIVNRMMKKVVDDYSGTGRNAKLPNVEVIGKTGTANDMSNLLFCGLTPDYVGVLRLGYDENKPIETYGAGNWRTVALIWHDVMVNIAASDVERSFTPESSVVVLNYCAETGKIATSKCPSTALGYYRQSNIPASCDDETHDGTYWSTHGDPAGFIPFYG